MGEIIGIKQRGPSDPGDEPGFDSFSRFDPEQFVRIVIARFEASSAMSLSASARERVVSPAIELRSQIIGEIEAGTATREKLAYAVTDLLRRAEQYAAGANTETIDEDAVLMAMGEVCHYLGWCWVSDQVHPKKEALQSASEFLKLTVTLATGALVFGAGLVKDASTLGLVSRLLIVGSGLLLGAAAATGVLALAAIPMMLERVDYEVRDKYFERPIQVHQLSLAAGAMLLGIALATAMFEKRPEPTKDSTDRPCRVVVMNGAQVVVSYYKCSARPWAGISSVL
jgi:hypothetical protein